MNINALVNHASNPKMSKLGGARRELFLPLLWSTLWSSKGKDWMRQCRMKASYVQCRPVHGKTKSSVIVTSNCWTLHTEFDLDLLSSFARHSHTMEGAIDESLLIDCPTFPQCRRWSTDSNLQVKRNLDNVGRKHGKTQMIWNDVTLYVAYIYRDGL